MSNDALDDRRKALEEQFFKNHDDELIAKMKASAAKAVARDEINHLTGISNPQVLDSLSDLKVPGGAAVLVMSLYPVVEVAWADGPPGEAEQKVVVDIANSMGLKAGSPGSEYLAQWLKQKPELKWHSLWADYVKELVARMKPDDRTNLKLTVLGRARVVAEASGGFLGIAFRVSDAEKHVLEGLEKAFD